MPSLIRESSYEADEHGLGSVGIHVCSLSSQSLTSPEIWHNEGDEYFHGHVGHVDNGFGLTFLTRPITAKSCTASRPRIKGLAPIDPETNLEAN